MKISLSQSKTSTVNPQPLVLNQNGDIIIDTPGLDKTSAETGGYDRGYEITHRISELYNSRGRSSTTIQMLEDKEKFLLAKINYDLDMLLELIVSIDSIKGKPRPNLRQSQGFNNVVVSGGTEGSQNQESPAFHDFRSDLRLCWMKEETKVAHSALNQLSYFIIQKKLMAQKFKELQNDKFKEKIEELEYLISKITCYFQISGQFQRRIQKFLLMGDEAGVQASLYLLYLLSSEVEQVQESHLKSPAASLLASFKDQITSLSMISNKSKRNKSPKKCWITKAMNQLLEILNQILSDENMKFNSQRLVISLLDTFSEFDLKQVKKISRKYNWFKTFYVIFQKDHFMTFEEGQEVVNSFKKYFTKEQVVAIIRNQSIFKIQQQFAQNELCSVENSQQYENNSSVNEIQVEVEQSLNFKKYSDIFQGIKGDQALPRSRKTTNYGPNYDETRKLSNYDTEDMVSINSYAQNNLIHISNQHLGSSQCSPQSKNLLGGKKEQQYFDIQEEQIEDSPGKRFRGLSLSPTLKDQEIQNKEQQALREQIIRQAKLKDSFLNIKESMLLSVRPPFNQHISIKSKEVLQEDNSQKQLAQQLIDKMEQTQKSESVNNMHYLSPKMINNEPSSYMQTRTPTYQELDLRAMAGEQQHYSLSKNRIMTGFNSNETSRKQSIISDKFITNQSYGCCSSFTRRNQPKKKAYQINDSLSSASINRELRNRQNQQCLIF